MQDNLFPRPVKRAFKKDGTITDLSIRLRRFERGLLRAIQYFDENQFPTTPDGQAQALEGIEVSGEITSQEEFNAIVGVLTGEIP